jgi:alkanesulfonate monooxygenase SsuD/methylene tetrahydromethanopterin reductase-like flavin-dependent oxidoreductase (luciferase family)
MKFGVFFPAFDALADPLVVVELSVLAESSGWDGVFLWDHLLYGERVSRILDPWICLAGVAAATSRIEIGPMVTPLARRRPAVLARQAVTLDLLSGGRLILGFGLGDDDWAGEFSRFGDEADPVRRGEQLDEGLEVLTGLLSGEPVSHQGQHHPNVDAQFLPTGVRPGGIPIWIGARWPHRRPMRRAARYDGAFVIHLDQPSNLAAIRETLTDVRGDLDGFEIVLQGVPGDDPTRWAQAGATWWLTQIGPYNIDVEAARRIIATGPRR